MIDYAMPCDIITERSLISGMVQDEVVFHKAVENLTANHFYHKLHQKIFESLKKEKSPGDLFILDTILKEDNELSITDFLGMSYTIKGDKEIERIVELYIRREIIKLSQNAINACLSEDKLRAMDISSKLAIDVSGLSIVRNNSTERIGNLLVGEFERIERVQKTGSSSFIKTGIKSIDDRLTISKKDYVIIGARPSNGKSTIAGLIGRNVSKGGGRVIVFYLDSAKEVEVSRALFTDAKCSLYDFNRGMMPRRDYQKLSFAAGSLSEIEYYLDDTPGITIDQIVAKSHRLKAEKGDIKLIIVDFIQNIRCNEYKTPREKINYISSILHELPRQIGCPVIALSQLSRYENEETIPPTRKLLKESGNLEQDADILILLHWPAAYPSFKETNEVDKQLFRVSIAKNKNGPTGYTKLNFIKETQEITDREEKYGNPSVFQNSTDF